jgi:hypothetical protein
VVSVAKPEKDSSHRHVIFNLVNRNRGRNVSGTRRRQINLQVEVVHVVFLVNDLDVLASIVKQLQLEGVNNVMEVNGRPEPHQIGLRILKTYCGAECD